MDSRVSASHFAVTSSACLAFGVFGEFNFNFTSPNEKGRIFLDGIIH